MQTSAKIRALFSLYPPLRHDSKSSSDSYYKFFQDFTEGRHVAIRGSFVHDGELLTVTVRKCTNSQLKRFFSKSPFLKEGDTILEFSGVFEFPGQEKFFLTDSSGAKQQQTEEQAIAWWKATLPGELELTIQSYLCALMIAYDGAIRPTDSIWIAGRSNYTRGQYHLSSIHEAIEYLRENDAFPSIDLDVETVVKWTFAQNGMFDGYSDTPASRAFNYFTRLFVRAFRNDELSDLVWALAGIEALLVESGRSSMGQLKEKLGAIFDKRIDGAWLSKSVSASYNFRSRMIHGDRQIRSFFREDEELNQKRTDEEYYSCLFVMGILFLLLKLSIHKNLTEIQFRTVLLGDSI
jgi:hypothetical protein